jgi:hypothetical protein
MRDHLTLNPFSAPRIIRLTTPALGIFFLLALTSGQESPATLPEAQVTFYSNEITVLGGTLGHKPGAFVGRIFDGDDQLAFMEPATFVTFHLTPGIHVFSATSWTVKHPEPGVHITVNLDANQHYFIESGSVSKEPLFLLRNVSCRDAQNDNARSKSLKATHLRAHGIPLVVHKTTFPPCP